MKKFIKVILSILLSIITIVNIGIFIAVQVKNINFDKEIQKQNDALVTEWYNENLTKEQKNFSIDKDYEIYINEIDKYVKNINVTHIYNTNVTYYDNKNKKTELQEKTIYNLTGNIWCNRLLFPQIIKNWDEVENKYLDYSKYGNGNLFSFRNMDYYEPLITDSNHGNIYRDDSSVYFPLELLQTSHSEKRQIIQTYNGVDYDVSNNDYKWSHWEHGHIASVDKSTDILTEAIFTFDDGTSKNFALTNGIDDKFKEEYNMINLYNLSKIELHFNSTVNYSEKGYMQGRAKACARFNEN